MSDNHLVDKDVQISGKQYTENGPLGGTLITEGYGEHADRKQDIDGNYIPWTGWVNGFTPVDDGISCLSDCIKDGQDFCKLVQGKSFDFADLLVSLSDEVGFAGDLAGFADPISSLAQWAVSWVFEHVTIFRVGLDMLAGNPDVIAAYSTTWANIADQLGQVGYQFTSTMTNGPGTWRGQAHDNYTKMAGDVGRALAGAQQVAAGMSQLIAALGQLVAGVRNLVKQLFAMAVGELVDAVEAVVGDDGQAADGTVAKVAKGGAMVVKLMTELTEAMKALPPVVSVAMTVVSAILKAAQSYGATS